MVSLLCSCTVFRMRTKTVNLPTKLQNENVKMEFDGRRSFMNSDCFAATIRTVNKFVIVVVVVVAVFFT